MSTESWPSWIKQKPTNLTGDGNPSNPDLVAQPEEKKELYENNPDPNKLVNPNSDSKAVDPNDKTARKFNT